MKGMKKVLWGICFWTALVAFTGYIALDTFVLTKSYNTNAVEMNTSMFEDVSAEEKDASPNAADMRTENNGDIIMRFSALVGVIPKPPNRMVNHAAARFFKTLIAPFGCRRGTAETVISHGSDSFLSGRRTLHFID